MHFSAKNELDKVVIVGGSNNAGVFVIVGGSNNGGAPSEGSGVEPPTLWRLF